RADPRDSRRDEDRAARHRGIPPRASRRDRGHEESFGHQRRRQHECDGPSRARRACAGHGAHPGRQVGVAAVTSNASPNSHHVTGHGPHAVLVLHGWFGDGHAFAPMEPALTADEFTYAFLDYRGYGDMRDAAGAYTIDQIA